eukprot:PLAT4835.2.p2 GENE.PLAT4835.2~~PLAT4835.2.p2  ORF type:complete len:254 (+),score=85.73 PLAT4835.2:281-1042(+)
MKFLECPPLQRLTSFLDGIELGEIVLKARLEAFSTRTPATSSEGRRLSAILDELAVGEPSPSPLGDLADVSTRALLVNLICTMNEAFPDYDFSCLRPEQFTREKDANTVINTVNCALADVIDVRTSGFLPQLWQAIDEVVALADCELYSYCAESDGDPFSDASLGSFNYFFYNAKLERIVYFTCVTTSAFYGMDDEDMMDMAEAEEEHMLTPADEEEDEEDDMLYDGAYGGGEGMATAMDMDWDEDTELGLSL